MPKKWWEPIRVFNPLIVVPCRALENAAFSRHEKTLDKVNKHLADCVEAAWSSGGFFVNMDDVIEGDYDVLSRVLTACNLSPDFEVIEDCIERDRWHHTRK